MIKNFTFYIIPDNTSAPKKFSLSLSMILFMVFFVMAGITALFFIIRDYNNLKAQNIETGSLMECLASRNEEIKLQRIAIRDFTKKINGLKKFRQLDMVMLFRRE